MPGLLERAGGPARQPYGRQAKVRRLYLDGAEDAFLPEVCARAAWSFVASASANAVHARRPRGHRVRLPRPLLRPDTLSPPFGPSRDGGRTEWEFRFQARAGRRDAD
jgi:hypothetical protein